MKVFFSWQSDSKGKFNKQFIREALELAAQEFSEEPTLEDVERESEAQISITQDIEGVPGLPDITQTIFKKIRETDVFVADATLVASS